MTPQPAIGAQRQHLDGRTVRDIVEYSPGEVDEPWCRRILRQVLQSLELQYAMHMPHRPVTPDTIVFHDNGEPLLVPTPGAEPEGSEAADLNALARVVHYAITQELAPEGPLLGRAPGYSDSLVAAVDRCMADDPAERPQTVAAVRELLGIVPLGLTAGTQGDGTVAPSPVVSPAAPPASAATPPPAILSHPSSALPASFAAPASSPAAPAGGTVRTHGLGRWQRRALAGGAVAVLAALALVVFAEMRDAGSFDHIVLTLPQTPETTAATQAPATTDAAAPAPASAAPVPAAGAATPTPAARAAATATATGNAYKLQIQPWGVVYVDDVDSGVSPPVKRLVLAPGKHTVRVANPNFDDRVLEVDSVQGGGSIAVDFNDASH